LALYDQAIRNECGYQGPMPFWDWSIDSEAPEKSEIWDRFGTTGCVTNLPGFSNRNATFPNTHCLLRQFNFQGQDSFFSPEQMGLIQSATNYDEFRRQLEGNPHNVVHSAIGGDMGFPLSAPNDPIFYLHHRNVDRHWAIWQKNNPSLANTFSGNVRPSSSRNRAKLSDIMPMFGLAADVAVSEAMNTDSGTVNGLFCFRFSNSITPNEIQLSRRNFKRQATISKTPPTNDRSQQFKIRVPSTLSDGFLKKWMYTEQEIQIIRQTESQVKQFTDFFNQFPLRFPSSLSEQAKGRKNGWRMKTDQEEVADKNQIQKLVTDFKAKK
jgi:hypothetical protein